MYLTICIRIYFSSIYRTNKEQYLADLTRDNVQLIVNELWEQPTERVEECVVARLPAPSFVLPRTRKCPVPRPLTKWEQFAQEKGIRKAKKDKKVFDEELDVRKTLSLNGWWDALDIVGGLRLIQFLLFLEMGSNIWIQTRPS